MVVSYERGTPAGARAAHAEIRSSSSSSLLLLILELSDTEVYEP